jgi:type VI secretion system secreted protein VgrG
MEIATPFEPDVLLFHRMHAREELGRLSHYEIELLSHPDHGYPDTNKILGQNVTVRLELPDEGSRFFNGFVTRFEHAGTHGRYNRFTASVQPWTWFLTRTADCRAFQDMTVPDIVKSVFEEHGVTDFKFDLTSDYRKWTYCVQYRETDFNFVSRLLEHEGIFYYFRHENGRHTMMLTDSTDKLLETPGYEVLKFLVPDRFVRHDIEYIRRWDLSREVQPGLFVHTDYDLTRPSVNLQTKKALPRDYTPSSYEIFDYPGYYMQRKDGEHYAAVRIDEFGTQFETAQADTNARGVAVGSLFTLDGHPRADQNREHVIISATYTLEFNDYEAMPPDAEPTHYHCSFAAMSSGQQFRPRRSTPRPFVQGPQTAVVVGPAGDEIYTDEYGRVKVAFHWDRYTKRDENSSCWIRVSQGWAGHGWGMFHTPRIGDEVIVSFLEGDPDQPIITGRVYNAENMPIYTVPANATHSGIKSRSSKGGNPNNFNEIRMEDTKGSELLYVQAEKDWRIHVKKNETENVGASISTSAGGGISRSSGGSHSRTAGDAIADKAKNGYTLNTGKGQALKAGGSYTLLTNEGIELKTINFVMELIEAGIESAMAALKGDAAEAAKAAKDFYKGDNKGVEALGNKIGAQVGAAFGPAVGAASGELTRIITDGQKGYDKISPKGKAAGEAAGKFAEAVQNDAGAEAIATAFVGMAVAAYEAYAEAKKVIDGLMPKIPSIKMWAMKNIEGEALWNVSFESKFRDVSLEAKARDVGIKAKKKVSIEAATKDLSLKASKTNVNMEATKKDINIKAAAKDIKITGKKKISIKAEDDNLVVETGKNMTVKAAKKMQLKCGSASITLLEGGDILIRGKAIKINATSGAVTVKGTPIKLN